MKRLYTLLFSSFFLLVLSFVASNPYPTQTLADFILTVEVKDENCSLDGELSFNVSQTLPAAEIEYTIYLLPETTKPIKVQKERLLGNLDAGNYRVVATQTLNGESSSETVEVTIAEGYQPLDFDIIAEDECHIDDGKITVEMLSGNASTYEIQGPVNLGPQSSNVFNNLPRGTYNVQVTNDCGERLSQNFEILKSEFFVDEYNVDLCLYSLAVGKFRWDIM